MAIFIKKSEIHTGKKAASLSNGSGITGCQNVEGLSGFNTKDGHQNVHDDLKENIALKCDDFCVFMYTT